MKKKIIIILTLFVILFTGCDGYLDVNKNVDAPDYVEAHLYLSGVLAAYQGLYWDIRATGPLSQMMGTDSNTSYANNIYPTASDSGGEMWRTTYWLQGYNLENMINQSMESEAWTMVGIGYAIKAFSWDQLTKQHVDLPMKEAFVPGLLAHNYDYQDDVYAQILEWAETAIEYLEMNDTYTVASVLSSADILFKGDKDKWLKFAHGVIVRNLASLTNKTDFVSKYAPKIIEHAAKAMQITADDATMAAPGGGSSVQFSYYNNFWGVQRGNLSNSYWQHDYIVQIMTGSVPQYDELTGDKVDDDPDPITGLVYSYHPWKLNPNQIITDTLVQITGHYDPRAIAKLGTRDDPYYKSITDPDAVKAYKFYGSNFTSATGHLGWNAPSFYGRIASGSTTYDGIGRWIYRNDAPYILMTASEMKFCLAETYWKMGDKASAFAAWKEGVRLDMEFTGKYLYPGSAASGGADVTGGGRPGGDKITVAMYNQFAQEYIAGPFVDGLTLANFTLSHIMMQKYVALFPWGASEAWVDLRKYHYDIKYTGDYPSFENGWDETTITQKWDTDPTKVYKGFYLRPAQVENRRTRYDIKNEGSPCYRIRPRYNSEYMWNVPSLEKLKPIIGTSEQYHTSIPWFAYPNGYPFQK